MTERYALGLNGNQNKIQIHKTDLGTVFTQGIPSKADGLLLSVKKLLICHGLQGLEQNQTRQTGKSLSDERKASSLGGLFNLDLLTAPYLLL